MADWQNSRLAYLDAADIDDDRVDFDGMEVLDPAGRKLGEVDGFILRRETGRPYYVVVDSGGWFSSRSFLAPIGHARLDPGNEALRIDLDKGTIERFPEFDEDRFGRMTEDEARVFNESTLQACCANELRSRTGSDRYDYDKWSHYAQPDWWQSTWFTSASPGLSTRETAHRTVAPTAVPPPPGPMPPRRPGERVIGRERDVDAERRTRDAEDDVNPLDRAQPGDVIGVETGGETTSLGDTARDEDERLRDAEEDAANRRRDELKDRR